METRSVSPAITSPSETPKEGQETNNTQPASESIAQPEEGLQEAPEKKQKISKTRSKPKSSKKVPPHKHKKPKTSNEPPSDSLPPSSSPSLPPPPPQANSPSDQPSESDTVVLLDDDDSDVDKIAGYVPIEKRSPESLGAAKVVSQSEMSPAALAIWKDILRKEVQLHELSKKAEAVMSVLNSQIEICRSLGVDVLSVDHKISDLMEFKAIHKKR